MPEKSLADKLRISAARAARAKNASDKAKAEASAATITRQAKKIAKKIIATLPKQLREAARDGRTILTVLDGACYYYELYLAVKSLLCQYANKNGIRWEEGESRPSDDMTYPCLILRWDKK